MQHIDNILERVKLVLEGSENNDAAVTFHHDPTNNTFVAFLRADLQRVPDLCEAISQVATKLQASQQPWKPGE